MASGDSDKPTEEPEHRAHWLRLVSRNHELELANAKLRSARKQFSDLFELAPVGYLVLDERGRILDANQLACQLLRTTKPDLVNRQFHHFVTPQDNHEITSLIESILLLGNDQQKRELHLLVDETRIDTLAYALAIEDSDRNRISCLISLIDLTPHNAAKREILEREKLLRLTLDAVNDGVWDWFPETGAAVFSEHYYTMLGYSPYEFPQEYGSWRSLVHPDDIGRVEADINRSISQGEGFALELRMRTKSGQWRWVLTRGKVVERGSDGHPIRVVGTHSDTTERKQAERALLESESRYRNLVENAQAGIWMVDANGITTFANRCMADMLSYTPAEMLGRSVSSFVGPNDPSAMRRAVDIMNSAATQEIDLNLTARDGTSVPCRLSAWPTTTSSGERIGATAFVTNRSEQRQMEAQLRQLQRLDAIGSLVGGVSHEFKNLLMGISAYTEVIQMALGPDHPQVGTTEDLLRCIDRARRLVDQLLAFGKRQLIDPHPTDVNVIVQQALSLIEKLIGEQIRLDVCLRPGPMIASLDSGQMEQVLINLVLNAKDAMPHGGTLGLRTDRVAVASRSDSGATHRARTEYAEILVTDNGIGMDDATRERVLEPFFSTKESAGHVGLGLSVAYGIVRQHGGHIYVSSKAGFGSAFAIRLPLVADKPDTSESIRGPVPTGSNETILIVEDEQIVRDPVRSLLESYGYNAIAVADGERAIEILSDRASSVAMVISDLVMPGISGVELYEAAKKIRPETKFLFMSGYAPASVDEASIPPADEPLIMKPFSLVDLITKVRQVLDSEQNDVPMEVGRDEDSRADGR